MTNLEKTTLFHIAQQFNIPPMIEVSETRGWKRIFFWRKKVFKSLEEIFANHITEHEMLTKTLSKELDALEVEKMKANININRTQIGLPKRG